MSDQRVLPDVPQQWDLQSNKNKMYSFDCKTCGKHYEYDSSFFLKDASVNIQELRKTDQVVRVSQDKIFPLIACIGAYYITHQWYHPPGTPLLDGVFLPVLTAVSVYIVLTVTIPMVFATGGVPIYHSQCSQCQSDLFFAAGKSKFGLPLQSPNQKNSTK